MPTKTVTIPDAWLIGCKQTVTLHGLKDDEGIELNGASLTATLRDKTGRTIDGAESIEADQPDPETPDYEIVLPRAVTLELVEDQEYTLTVTDGADFQMRFDRCAQDIEG